ncbi:MAG: hypothetical protein V2A76_04165 [Planctomycetota bacterium]
MSVSDRQQDCPRFASLLAEYLEGDLSSSETTWMVSHRDNCPRCWDALQAAADVAEALASWPAPAPPSRLRERILCLIRRTDSPGKILCSDLRAELDAWASGDLSHERSEALSCHAKRCAPCGHQVAIARGVDSLLANWIAPSPRADFADRVVAATQSDILSEVAETGPAAAVPRPASPVAPPWRRFGLGRSAIAAAAALLMLAYLGLRDLGEPTRAGRSSEPTVNDLLARYELDVRLRAVSTEQFPASIGSFDSQPLVLDRGRRITGNAFHRSLRKALARSAMGMDR